MIISHLEPVRPVNNLKDREKVYLGIVKYDKWELKLWPVSTSCFYG